MYGAGRASTRTRSFFVHHTAAIADAEPHQTFFPMPTLLQYSTLQYHGGWPMAAGPASRLGSIEPGEKTGLRLSPTPST